MRQAVLAVAVCFFGLTSGSDALAMSDADKEEYL
tara:strand:+ start:213 stop:314 length:102 start_codon:yes stop_codon:yes gene_type:complete